MGKMRSLPLELHFLKEETETKVVLPNSKKKTEEKASPGDLKTRKRKNYFANSNNHLLFSPALA